MKIKKLRKAGRAIISVSNTGKRVDRGMYSKLFTKFATASSEGTGLGLYIFKEHNRSSWRKNQLRPLKSVSTRAWRTGNVAQIHRRRKYSPSKSG